AERRPPHPEFRGIVGEVEAARDRREVAPFDGLQLLVRRARRGVVRRGLQGRPRVVQLPVEGAQSVVLARLEPTQSREVAVRDVADPEEELESGIELRTR